MHSVHWQKILAQRVVEICREQRLLDAVECEGLVQSWLEDIQKASRPTTTGVIMDAQRILYNLTPIH